MKHFSSKTKVGLSLLVSVVLPIGLFLFTQRTFGTEEAEAETLHALIESLGACIALGVAGLLWLRLRYEPDNSGQMIWIVAALLGMGILDAAHAAVPVSFRGGWMRSLASLLGGALFCGVLLPERWTKKVSAHLPGAAGGFAFLLATALWFFGDRLPTFNELGFTPLMRAVNYLACVFFLGTAGWFIQRNLTSHQAEDLIFANHCLLFSTASALFAETRNWQGGWWFFHFVRLAAYLIVVRTAISVFHRMQETLRKHHAELESRVAQRTAELSREQARTETILASITEAFYVLDREYRFTYANPSAIRTFNEVRKTTRSVLGQTVWEEFPGTVGSNFETNCRRAMDSQVTVSFETFYEASQGWFQINVFPSSEGLSIFFQNITERKRAEDVLRESEERFRAMADNIAPLAWMANPDGWIFFYNKRWYDYTGATLEQMQGWGWAKVHHPDHLARVTKKWSEHLQLGRSWEDTFPLRGRNGQYRWFLSRAFPIRDEQGNIVRWFGTNTDITELLEAQEGLKLAQKELQEYAATLEQKVKERTADLKESNEQLEAFVYSIAHDLRAPLRSMQGFSRVLIEDCASALDETGHRYLDKIKTSSEFMDKMILDLLAFGRTARSEIQSKTVEVETAWKAALYQCANQIEQTKAQIDTNPPLLAVCAHEATLTQILANLLSNGIKFVEPGVQPNIRFTAEDCGATVRLWVQDNGVGISPEHHERVFRVFERLHGARFTGTGIGLSIVRKGVERMGGKVGLESEPNKGTRFWIELQKG